MEKHTLEVISFSSLSDFKTCGWFFKLKHILKLLVDGNTIWTHYGTLVHKYVQAVLLKQLTPEEASKKFIRTWFKFCNLYKKDLKEQYKDDPVVLYKGPVRAIMCLQETLDDYFGVGWEVIGVELKLKEKTDFSQIFKGFVDVILKTNKGKIAILDLKTCKTHFAFEKYNLKDKFKNYQLSLYKHYFCVKTETDPKDIETYFVTIARSPQEKKPLKIMRVTSGTKKLKNAIDWLNQVLSCVEREVFIKNRTQCENMYGSPCPFYKTEHCK